MSATVTCSLTATRSNECTLLGTLAANLAFPQPKSATTKSADLGKAKKRTTVNSSD